ncbi:DUF2628 domain-containing protein [Fictibacillus sp. BK138]|uniref:DUF2628 domain-containing protein n=1 Tax=Fictibacillus sp. BK138 TaxID=2512121 RepID=UPI001029A903|nr:DUF2628 domain-containing protein [Fictibacillus sp. BK138]RZT21524.1 uncharacterized protein DUF2628 [Fictibacillus sp. BK138]
MGNYSNTSISKADVLIDTPQGEKLALFVGEKKKDFYFKKRQKDNSWNWAAFFLTFLWLGYRKMYLPILFVLIGFLAIDIIALLLGTISTTVDTSMGFALSGGLGVGGNLIYKRHAQKQINEIEKHSVSEKVKMHEIRKRGGTSWMGVLLALLMFIGYLVISAILLTTFS